MNFQVLTLAYSLVEVSFIIFLENTKLKIVWKKITTFFTKLVSIIT